MLGDLKAHLPYEILFLNMQTKPCLHYKTFFGFETFSSFPSARQNIFYNSTPIPEPLGLVFNVRGWTCHVFGFPWWGRGCLAWRLVLELSSTVRDDSRGWCEAIVHCTTPWGWRCVPSPRGAAGEMAIFSGHLFALHEICIPTAPTGSKVPHGFKTPYESTRVTAGPRATHGRGKPHRKFTGEAGRQYASACAE